jgi:S-DNA-T family DNA segregation ATPase FtsK/SpoIIIE
MARTASTSNSGALLPAGATDFLRRRLRELGGLIMIAGGSGLVAALVTFSPGDPSLNSASGAPVHNLLGPAGAYLSDALLQGLGLAAFLPSPVLAVWGWKLLRKRRVLRPWWRLGFLMAAMVLAAAGAAPVPNGGFWPLATGLGGVGGALVLAKFSNLLAYYAPAVDPRYLSAACAGLAVPAFLYALGLSFAEWRAFISAFFRAGKGLISGLRRIGALFAGVRQPLSGAHRICDRRLETAPRAKAAAKRRKPFTGHGIVQAKTPKSKTGRQTAARRQRKLDLEPGDSYALPPHDLLEAPPTGGANERLSRDALESNARLLESVLDDYGVRGQILKVRPGPVVTLYELEPAAGVKTSRVIGLADDIARSMSAVSVRVAVVPGRNAIGIELPNVKREMVYLREMISAQAFERAAGKLTLALGKDIGGAPVMVDLARMPHLLIAGTTGSGKSVGINTMILSLLYQLPPEQCKFIMVDPKMLELSVYEGIPHLLSPVVTDPAKAVMALKWTVREMEDRYRAMSQLGVRNLAGYNSRIAEAVKKGEAITRRVQTGFDEDGKPMMEDQPLPMEPLPFIVVVVDEMADLMLVAGKDIEAAVQRLAQMARAAGIHLIMATQRPSVDVITGTIKANFPTRVSFQVTSKIDSRTILGEQGAEQLLGQGDMLYMAAGGRVTRVHGPFVSDEEVENVVAHLKAQGRPAYIDAVTEEEIDAGALALPGRGGQSGDELYDEAVAIIAREGKASTSFIQRHLQIGYNRAARIIERMEKEGVISKANRVGRREVLIGGGDHAA